MAELESKGAENGDLAAPVAADSVEVQTGEAHLPSAETISAAEALKAEGNALLGGELLRERACRIFMGCGWGCEAGSVPCRNCALAGCSMEVRLP